MFTSKALLDTAIEMAPEESTALLQKWLNHGNTQLNAVFNRYWNRTAATTDIVASQQYYQLPEDCIKVISVVITQTDGTSYILKPIENEDSWRELTSGQLASFAYPLYYFVRGADEVGIFPLPTNLITNGLEVSYLPRQNEWRFLEYNTGTVTVNAGSPLVTIASGTFLQQQIGMSFKVDDGTHDRWYKINEFVSGTQVRLENNYGGYSGAGKTYIVGEIPIIPDEFHENVLDYAMFRHNQKMGNTNDANGFAALFADAKIRLQAEYATKTNNQVIRPRGRNYALDPFTRIPDAIT